MSRPVVPPADLVEFVRGAMAGADPLDDTEAEAVARALCSPGPFVAASRHGCYASRRPVPSDGGRVRCDEWPESACVGCQNDGYYITPVVPENGRPR